MGQWLTFWSHPGIEPTSNPGEREPREAVMVRKVIGTLSNARDANVFARLKRIVGTWRAHGEDPAVKFCRALNRKWT
jgi:hypothetical protein